MTGPGAFCAALTPLRRCGAQYPKTSGNTQTGNQSLVRVFSDCFLKIFYDHDYGIKVLKISKSISQYSL